MSLRAERSEILRLCAGLLALAWLASCVTASPGSRSPRVETANHTIEGLSWTGHGEGGIFLGVPFAQAPIGDLRWQPPQPFTSSRATFAAKEFAPACIQGNYIVSWYEELASSFGGDKSQVGRPISESEDCLYLNIWTPDLAPEETLPVMVWIHGGSYRGGWSYEPNYIGRELASRGVVVVSIAYRLGALGYLGPDAQNDGPLNFGMMDQLAALNWVADNIRVFGGDATNVTVFGESAGAAAIGTLMVTPQADNLFHRAISQSAGFEFLAAPDRKAAATAFSELSQQLEAAGTTPMAATAEQILHAANEALSTYDFAPVVDGMLIKDQPREMLNDKQVNAVDLIIGTNRDEWLMYLDHQSLDEELSAWTNRVPEAAEVIASMVDLVGAAPALDRIETAYQMRCPGRRFAKIVSALGASTYVYEFDRRRDGALEAGLGSYHGAEIPYVFGTHDVWLPTTNTDSWISAAMMGAWTSFASTGEPKMPGSEDWPEFGRTGRVLSIDEALETSSPRDEELCGFLASRKTEMDE